MPLIAVLIGVVLWVPPVIDQLINDPGNVRTLLDHFGDPPEPVLGFADGIRLALRHLDVWAGFAGFTGDLEGAGRFVSPASTWRGAVVLGVWLVSVIVARRTGPVALRRLHAVIAAALVLGLVAMVRIFGLPWYYLTLWAWGTTTLAVGAVAWTGLSWWRRRSSGEGPAVVALPALSVVVLVVTTLASAVVFADAEVPEARLSRAVGAVAAPTYDAIVDAVGVAVGPDGRYQVRWSDAADIGSPGFGLLDELERRGLDVAADEFFHVPVTDHRVRPRTTADAQIHLATGSYIERWRQVPGAVEVATYEPRSAAEIARADELRARVLARLRVEGLDDVAAQVDTNLFGASLDPRISAADLADLTELLDLGQPTAVFIAPPDADAVTPATLCPWRDRLRYVCTPLCRTTATSSAAGEASDHVRRRARALTATATAAKRPRWWRSANSSGKAGVGGGASRRTVVTTSAAIQTIAPAATSPAIRMRLVATTAAPPASPHNAHAGSTNSAASSTQATAATTLRASPSERQLVQRAGGQPSTRTVGRLALSANARTRATNAAARLTAIAAFERRLRRPADPHRHGAIVRWDPPAVEPTGDQLRRPERPGGRRRRPRRVVALAEDQPAAVGAPIDGDRAAAADRCRPRWRAVRCRRRRRRRTPSRRRRERARCGRPAARCACSAGP